MSGLALLIIGGIGLYLLLILAVVVALMGKETVLFCCVIATITYVITVVWGVTR